MTTSKKTAKRPIISCDSVMWFTTLKKKKHPKELSVWQSIIYLMKHTGIAPEELQEIQHHLSAVEYECCAEYIQAMTESGDELYFAPARNIPTPAFDPDADYELVSLADVEDNEDDFRDLVIHPDYIEQWYEELENSRRLILPDLPTVAYIHALITAEIDRFERNLRSELDIKPVTFPKHPFRCHVIIKASLNDWSKVPALKSADLGDNKTDASQDVKALNQHMVMYTLLMLLQSKHEGIPPAPHGGINMDHVYGQLQEFSKTLDIGPLPKTSTLNKILSPFAKPPKKD